MRLASLSTSLLALSIALNGVVASADPASPQDAASEAEAMVDLGSALHAALSEAVSHGDRSLVASVIENARPTPWRASDIAQVATLLRPGLAPEVSRAAATGRTLSMGTWALPPAGATVAAQQQTQAPLPPGADPNFDPDAMTEEQRNYGYNMIGAEAAAALGLSGKGIVVGVIDTGIARREGGELHPEFEGRLDPRSLSLFHWVDAQLKEADLAGLTSAEQIAKIFDRAGADGWEDIDGHGTHVAGTIGAARDGKGMVGIAPGSTLLTINAVPAGDQAPGMGGLTFAQLAYCGPAAVADGCAPKWDDDGGKVESTVEAIRRLTNFTDVRIVNGSYGPITAAGATTADLSTVQLEAEAVVDFVRSGKIFVVAAGNNFENAPIQAVNPAGIGLFPAVTPDNDGLKLANGDLVYEGTGGADMSLLRPDRLAADEDEAGKEYGRLVVVVAVDARKEIASYSNRCGIAAEWCIAAPGGDTFDPKTKEVTQLGVLAPYPDNLVPIDPEDYYNDGGKFTGGIRYDGEAYLATDGTSMAAPHVSGALAILMEAYPNETPGDLVALMFRTAEDLGAPGVDAIYGHGLIRLDRALAGPIGLPDGGSGTTYTFDTATGHTFAFPFTHEGAFTKTGAGTLKIEAGGIVGFDGDGKVSGGEIEVGSGSGLRFGGTAEVDGGTLEVGAGGTMTSGGETGVTSGTLKVDGRVAAPTVRVARGGTLTGTGRVDGTTTVDGTLSPGASPGTLTFGGTLALGPTATTRIEVDGPAAGTGAGAFDRLIVNGTGTAFTAGGTLVPVLRGISGPATNAFTPVLGQTFTFVATPNGTIAGAFAGLTQPTTGLGAGTRFDVLYGTRDVSLVVTPLTFGGLAAAGVTLDPGARAFASALDTIRPAAGARTTTAQAQLFDTLYQTSAAVLPVALSAGAGTLHVDAGQEALATLGRMADLLRFRAVTAGETWIVPMAAEARVASGAEGYSASSGGLAFGTAVEIDQGVPAGTTLGFAGAYVETRVTDRFGTADIEMGQIAVQGATRLGAFDVATSLGVAAGDVTVDRTSIGGRAMASRSVRGAFAQIAAARDVTLGRTVLTPRAALGWQSVTLGGTTETGASPLTLAEATYDETFVEIGMGTRTALEGLGRPATFTASASLRGSLDGIDATAPHAIQGAAFQAMGADPGGEALRAAIGLDVAVTDTSCLSVNLSHEARRDGDAQTVGIGFDLRF
ncbi:MAG: S8 family serine peptidase [Shimia sp.]